MDVEMFERSLASTGRIVAGITKEQLENPTPCSEWSVRDALNHLINQTMVFGSGLDEDAPPDVDGVDSTEGDYVAAFDEVARKALDTFRTPGALEKTFKTPWGETPGAAVLGLALGDSAIHGWDLAKGTGQDPTIDDDIAEALYGMVTSMMQPKGSYPREGAFGPPIEVPDDASPQERLLSYVGRRP